MVWSPLAAGAGQVGVGGTPAVLGVNHHQAGAATSAVDAATQVMQVAALVDSRVVVGCKQILDLLPGLRVNRR